MVSSSRYREALALSWAHIREHTILVERAASLGEIAPTKTGQTRTVRLLQPLAKDLNEWRLASGRPDDSALIFPGVDGRPWTRTSSTSTPSEQSAARRRTRSAQPARGC